MKVLDYLFPKFCVGCQREGVFLCSACQKKILLVAMPTCPDCQRLSEKGRYCQKCRKGKALKGIIIASYYEEGPMREIIHNFKYNSVIAFGDFLAKILANSLKNFEKFDLITFVPLHPRRQAQRGYNQSQILAENAAKILNKKCENLLIKTKATKRQVGLQGAIRRKNLKGVFRVKKDIDINSKNIIIIDDITTTGTTLNECARSLKEAGAREVWGLVVARG